MLQLNDESGWGGANIVLCRTALSLFNLLLLSLLVAPLHICFDGLSLIAAASFMAAFQIAGLMTLAFTLHN